MHNNSFENYGRAARAYDEWLQTDTVAEEACVLAARIEQLTQDNITEMMRNPDDAQSG